MDRAVIVPPSPVGDENLTALEAAVRHPTRLAVMGRLDTGAIATAVAAAIGAEVAHDRGEWKVARAIMSRSARRLMEGWIRVPTVERGKT